MRRLFNEGRFYQRLLSGDLIAGKENVYKPQTVGDRIPIDSKSVELFYFTQQGIPVAQVQQFVTSSGNIGASGKPDPKRLYIKGVTYAIVRKNR